MTSIRSKVKRFDRVFKMDAARLVVEGGKKTAEVSKDLGISYQTVNSWVRSYRLDASEAFPGSGRVTASEAEWNKLVEENRQLKMQTEFLKKTMFYFVEKPK